MKAELDDKNGTKSEPRGMNMKDKGEKKSEVKAQRKKERWHQGWEEAAGGSRSPF